MTEYLDGAPVQKHFHFLRIFLSAIIIKTQLNLCKTATQK